MHAVHCSRSGVRPLVWPRVATHQGVEQVGDGRQHGKDATLHRAGLPVVAGWKDRVVS